MTQIGADTVFARFALNRCGSNRAFASAVTRNTKRAGEQFAEVGPHFKRS
jgi:hypothetical protein